MLKALVKEHDKYPSLVFIDPSLPPTKWQLARKADIISVKECELAVKYRVSLDSCGLPQDNMEQEQVKRLMGVAGDLDAAIHEMRERGWVSAWDDHAWPTKDGIDYARLLLRPWYRKILDYFERDIRAIVVAVITAVITTLVVNFLLGWLR